MIQKTEVYCLCLVTKIFPIPLFIKRGFNSQIEKGGLSGILLSSQTFIWMIVIRLIKYIVVILNLIQDILSRCWNEFSMTFEVISVY